IKKADDSAPSKKYLSDASCDSSRRRRASPQSRYSGKDKISNATNMVIKSLEAGKSIIPNTANSARGNTSVCSTRLRIASRSATVPGTAAACGAKTLVVSILVSANVSSDAALKMSRIVHMKYVGPSSASELTATTASSPDAQFNTVVTNARAKDTKLMRSCTTRQISRGATASAKTPKQAPAKITKTGASRPYSIFGAVICIGDNTRVIISGLPLRSPLAADQSHRHAAEWPASRAR